MQPAAGIMRLAVFGGTMKSKYFHAREIMRGFDEFDETHIPIRQRYYDDFRTRKDAKKPRIIYDTHNFKCLQCGFFVTAARELSGVNNRNHCPRCLWSRHMDLNTPGDRKSECRSRMEPIGLTLKQVWKRYGGEGQGELMLIHRCTGCGKVSINRTAGDDDAFQLFQVYLNSLSTNMDALNDLEFSGITILGEEEEYLVKLRIFGNSNN